MSIELVACPKCGGCGFVQVAFPNSAGWECMEECDGCCAQGYVPVQEADSRCPVCGAESGGDLCDSCTGYSDRLVQVDDTPLPLGEFSDIPF